LTAHVMQARRTVMVRNVGMLIIKHLKEIRYENTGCVSVSMVNIIMNHLAPYPFLTSNHYANVNTWQDTGCVSV
jgi:hypothetical protein